MSSDVKVLSRTRVSHEKGRLTNMTMPIETAKQADGTFKAFVRGQESQYSATGQDEGYALYNLKQVIKDKMLSGDFKNVNQQMI